jgi:hypothetical protein
VDLFLEKFVEKDKAITELNQKLFTLNESLKKERSEKEALANDLGK